MISLGLYQARDSSFCFLLSGILQILLEVMAVYHSSSLCFVEMCIVIIHREKISFQLGKKYLLVCLMVD